METTSQLLPIRIGTLRANSTIFFDLYIQIGDRHLHYIRKNDPIEASRLKNLKTKGVKKLFVPEKEEDLYLKYLDAGLDEVQNKTNPIDERGKIVADSLVTSAENADRNLETEAKFTTMQQQINKVINFFSSESAALQSVLSATGKSEDTSVHAANVGSMCLALAPAVGLKDPKILLDLGIAALLHDHGKKTLNIPESARIENLSGQDLIQFMQHPTAALQELSNKKYVSALVLKLIECHEERGNGEGYPNKRNIERLDLACQVLNLCNDFDHYISGNNLNPLDGVNKYFDARGDQFNADHLTALGNILTARAQK